MELYYNLDEVSQLLHRDKQTVVRDIKKGIIPTHPDYKHIVPKEYVDIWDVDTKETFRERKLKQELELNLKEIQELKNIIREILKIGMEVKI